MFSRYRCIVGSLIGTGCADGKISDRAMAEFKKRNISVTTDVLGPNWERTHCLRDDDIRLANWLLKLACYPVSPFTLVQAAFCEI
jgi:hypothetical protein